MNIDELNTQLDYLAETKEQIKSAITNKGQEIISDTPFREYVEKINNISTLQADTADADALAEDIVSGKTAYVNGQKITGNVSTFASGMTALLPANQYVGNAANGPRFEGTENGNVHLCDGAIVRVQIDESEVAKAGNITPDKIVQGNTIFGIVGTASTGGLDTSDATVLANDICMGKTAYARGEKITGNIQEIVAEQNLSLISDETLGTYPDNNQISFTTKVTSDILFRENSVIEIKKDISELAIQIGLTPDILKKGVTILGVTGTYEADTEAQEQITNLTNTIDESNNIAEDILGTNV